MHDGTGYRNRAHGCHAGCSEPALRMGDERHLYEHLSDIGPTNTRASKKLLSYLELIFQWFHARDRTEVEPEMLHRLSDDTNRDSASAFVPMFTVCETR